MQATIKSPDNPIYPSAVNTLTVDSFNGIPPSNRWGIGITTINKDGTASYVELQAGNDSMTQKEWDNWTNQPDSYALQCTASHKGFVLA